MRRLPYCFAARRSSAPYSQLQGNPPIVSQIGGTTMSRPSRGDLNLEGIAATVVTIDLAAPVRQSSSSNFLWLSWPTRSSGLADAGMPLVTGHSQRTSPLPRRLQGAATESRMTETPLPRCRNRSVGLRKIRKRQEGNAFACWTRRGDFVRWMAMWAWIGLRLVPTRSGRAANLMLL